MDIKYQYFPEHQFMLMKYVGKFSLMTYFKCTRYIMEQEYWKDIKVFLLDMRETWLDKKEKNILNDLNVIRNKSDFTGYKISYLVQDPILHANLILYLDDTKSTQYQYFSTLQPAIEHLELSFLSEEIENRLNNLTQTFYTK